MAELAVRGLTVEFESDGYCRVSVGTGNYLGELGPLLELPRSASARARGTARLTGPSARAFRCRFPAAGS